jgi:hypothetical protein
MTEPTIGDQQHLRTLLVTAGVIGIVAALAVLTVYVAHDVLLVYAAVQFLEGNVISACRRLVPSRGSRTGLENFIFACTV